MKKTSPSDEMKQSIRNVFWLYAGLFTILIIYLAYFMLVTSKNIVTDPHNPRLYVLENEVHRGTIYDSRGTVIAESHLNDGTYKRNYPFERNMSHLLGYVGYGKAGIEAAYNFELQRIHNEVFQRVRQLFQGTELVGNSLYLTIDTNVQSEVYSLLGNRKGAVIVMEPETGRIISMASYPNYNPNTIVENWKAIDADENAPFINRVTQGLYTPGSVFKIVSALDIINNNENYANTEFDCEGETSFKDKVIHCIDGKKHGSVDIFDAMAVSCNTYFSEQINTLGAESLINASKRVYFNQSLGYELEYNKSVFQLTAASTESELAETAIGQGKTLISPLHLAMISSAVANKGVMMKPYVLDRVCAYNGREVKKNLPKMIDSIFTVEESEILREMLHEAVARGTGNRANVEGAFVAGKTGTAENPKGTAHSWFCGFAEKDGRTVSIAIVLENPEGGQSAVPIAGKILRAALEN